MFELYSSGNYSLNTLRKEMIKFGFIFRNGKNFHKSKVEKILKNEFYTGIFYWKGKRYENAKHTPIVSKELFKKVQMVLRNPNKRKSRKGLFPYTNIIKCGYCNGSLTAELKKNRYVYYRCSQNGENHGQRYLTEKEIEQQFADYLKNIELTQEQVNAILQGLREFHKDKIAFNEEMVKQLNNSIQKYQNRIDKMYLDKLDGKISEEFWARNYSILRNEKDDFEIQLQSIKKTDKNYFESSELILELSRRAYKLFLEQEPEEKRKLLKLITAECEYKNNQLHIKLKAPFDKVLLSKKSSNILLR